MNKNSERKMIKLNLGCGNDIKEGYINLDILGNKGVDLIHDLNVLPLPIKSNSIDYIYCKDILEHNINYLELMKELYRILKKEGILRIIVPHFTSRSNYADPTHKHFFSSETFYYFINSKDFAYNRNVKFFSKISVRIELELSERIILKQFLKLLYNWINKSKRNQFNYERTFLNIFPSNRIHIILIK